MATYTVFNFNASLRTALACFDTERKAFRFARDKAKADGLVSVKGRDWWRDPNNPKPLEVWCLAADNVSTIAAPYSAGVQIASVWANITRPPC